MFNHDKEQLKSSPSYQEHEDEFEECSSCGAEVLDGEDLCDQCAKKYYK